MSLHKPLTKKQSDQLHKILLDERRKISHHLSEISEDAEEVEHDPGPCVEVADGELPRCGFTSLRRR